MMGEVETKREPRWVHPDMQIVIKGAEERQTMLVEDAKEARARRKRRMLGIDEAARPGIELEQAEVKDPYPDVRPGKEPKPVRVMRNVNASPSRKLAAAGVLDTVQETIAFRVETIFERASFGIGAIDYSRTKVDGGIPGDPVTDRQMDAQQAVNEIALIVSPMAYHALRSLLSEQHSVGFTAVGNGRRNMRAEGRVYGLPHEALYQLGKEWGMLEARRR